LPTGLRDDTHTAGEVRQGGAVTAPSLLNAAGVAAAPERLFWHDRVGSHQRKGESTMHASSPATSRPARIGSVLATISLTTGLGCAVAALLAGPAYRAEWLSLGAGLQTVRWAATISVAAAALAFAAAVLVGCAGAWRRLRIAVAALAFNLLVAGWPLYV